MEAITSKRPGMTALVDRLLVDPEVQSQWQVDPEAVMDGYELTDDERSALRDGDVEVLVASGVSDKLSRQMTVSW